MLMHENICLIPIVNAELRCQRKTNLTGSALFARNETISMDRNIIQFYNPNKQPRNIIKERNG